MKHIHIPEQFLGARPIIMTGAGKSEMSLITDGHHIKAGGTLTDSSYYNIGDYSEFEISEVKYSRPAIMVKGGKYPRVENPISVKFTVTKTGKYIQIEEIAKRMGWMLLKLKVTKRDGIVIDTTQYLEGGLSYPKICTELDILFGVGKYEIVK